MGIFKLNGIDYMGGGGGGNANEQTLTWAEYCALTKEEKSNGTTYYITDINGKGKDEFQPVIYSTEEREIGVWTDGKPLYEKTLYVASGQINSSTVLNMPTQNDIERLVLYKGSVYDINDQRYYALPYERMSSVEGIWILCHVLSDHTLTPVLFTRQSSTYSLSNIFVTLQYTKTTDQPGSGTWTPQGVPATHYSTDEQVVGTWTDGSTIYEKSYTIPQTSSGYTVFNFTGLNINEAINVYTHEGTAFAPSTSETPYGSAPLSGYTQSSAGELGFVGFVTHDASTGVYQLHYRVGSSLSGGTARVTVRYNKVTS